MSSLARPHDPREPLVGFSQPAPPAFLGLGRGQGRGGRERAGKGEGGREGGREPGREGAGEGGRGQGRKALLKYNLREHVSVVSLDIAPASHFGSFLCTRQCSEHLT